MNSDKKPCLDRERKECDVQILPMEQLLKVAEEVLKQRDSTFKRLAE